MLLVIAGGEGRTTVAMWLVAAHKFVGQTKLPKSPVAKGARVVVDIQPKPVTAYAKTLLNRKVRKLGGIVLHLDSIAEAMEVVLPNPLSVGQEAAFAEVDRLMALLGAKKK